MGPRMSTFIAIVLGIVTSVFLLYGVKKVLAGRYHVEPAVSASLPLDEQRLQAFLRQDDFKGSSHQVAFEWFEQEFGVAPAPGMRLKASGFVFGRGQLQRQADRVLEIARSTNSAAESRDEFYALIEAIRTLSIAVRDGELTLLADEKM